MNTRRMTSVVLLPLLSALLLGAAEPWNEKPYTEWSEKEVQRVFTDSPWAHSYVDPQAHGALGPMKADASGTVQWASARTVREAIVRQKQLKGVYKAEEATRFLSATPTHHVLLVFGPSARLFEWVTEKEAQEAARLRLKRHKKEIPATSVRFIHGDAKIAAAEFLFDRETDGQATVAADEEKVSFICSPHNITISVEFDLRKMVRDGKPDL